MALIKVFPLLSISQRKTTACSKLFLDDTGTQKLLKYIQAPVYASLEQALKTPLARHCPAIFSFFSPAFASFGMFTNDITATINLMALVEAL